MKNTLIVFYFLLVQIGLLSQTTGPFLPLSFENATPVWYHLSIDSSIIGLENTSTAKFGSTYDGMSHLILGDQSNIYPIIEGDYLYIILSAVINGDIGGSYIEKIDLTTGNVLWKKSIDLRIDDKRDQPKVAKIVGNKLLVFGYRRLTEDHPLIPTPHLLLGRASSLLVKKEIDKNTGDLLDEFVADESDPENLLFKSIDRLLDFNLESEELNYYWHRTIPQNYVEHIKTDLEGRILSSDTIRGALAHLDWVSTFSNFSSSGKISVKDKNLYILDTYIPDSIELKPEQAAIARYDRDGSIIFSTIIPKTELDTFGQLYINSITDEFLLLEGYYNKLIANGRFFLVLSKETGEVLSKIETELNGELLGNLVLCSPENSDQLLLFFNYEYDEINQTSIINVYTIDNSNQLELVKSIKVLEEKYVAIPNKARYLPNGDVLLYVIHHYGESLDGRFSNWIRFTQEELGLGTVSTKEHSNIENIEIYPNPTDGFITIDKAVQYKTYTITNLYGAIVQKGKSEVTINVGDLPSGSYFLQIFDEKGYLGLTKMIKI